ncbi:MAG: CcdC protein domain-containing protein [Chthoniobacterales bacterium]
MRQSATRQICKARLLFAVPFLPLLVLLALPFVFLLAMPFSLVQRYRFGKARRPARRWLARINLALLLLSAAFFIYSAALTNFWIPHAFHYALIGVLIGLLLGFVGLALTRWEATDSTVHYTPNRRLVLILTVAVALRLLYGVWRLWEKWNTAGQGGSWLASAGIADSLAVGGAVLGHYVCYAAGILVRLRRHRARPRA